ncbi:interactor protein for cytohesin exchange factors 1-like [Solea solea]|uniref:interactor protein for cytohesin exchange factors 1-like n=1 Tax=Solea solea TaxID=90069 RepID=UPI00272DA8A2|nr:interactor protein for cytohesin exchange factors 1-like [Solea solea]
MSRRRVSVRNLGPVDIQGWLQRRKDRQSFLGSKWKKYWFVLKKSFLYWYIDKMAEKAEGFINLCGFTVEQAKQSRRKHAMAATHPQVVTIVMAAENATEMNKWISKLSKASESSSLDVLPRQPVSFTSSSPVPRPPVLSSSECYSEGSDQDGDESELTEQETVDSEDVGMKRHCESLSCTETPSIGSERTCGDAASVGGVWNRSRRRAFSEGHKHLTWLDLHRPNIQRLDPQRPDLQRPDPQRPDLQQPDPQRPDLQRPDPQRPDLQQLDVPKPDRDSEAVSLPLIYIGEMIEEEARGNETPLDEMESLYVHLKASSLSLVGQSSHRDFRASFIRRCKNDKVNENLHLLRILSSTLKAKEAELKAMEQILTEPALSPPTYRKWKLANLVLLQEIIQCNQAAGGAAGSMPPERLRTGFMNRVGTRWPKQETASIYTGNKPDAPTEL